MRIIVFDRTIIDQINLGNAEVAKSLRTVLQEGAEVWTTREIYSRGTEADRLLIDNSGIHVVPVADSYADNKVTQGKVDRIPHANWKAAALAEDLKVKRKSDVELMTADRSTADAYRKYNGRVTPLAGRTLSGKNFNYNQARRLMQLKPLNLTAYGDVVRTARGKGKAPNMIPRTIDRTWAWKETSPGKKGTTPAVGEPSPRGQATVGGLVLAFQGVNWMIQQKAAKISEQRFEADWARKRPEIERILNEDPTLGVKLFTYFQRGADDTSSGSIIEPTSVYHHMHYATGYTESEADQNFAMQKNYDGAAGNIVAGPDNWFPPRVQVSPEKLKTPFRSQGLGTFVRGKEKLRNVKWKGLSGFDDLDQTELDVPKELTPQFLILVPPDEITFYNGSSRHTADIDQRQVHPAEVNSPLTGDLTVWVVELDAHWRPYADAKAAMVFPANQYTQTLFKKAPKTRDNLGQLNPIVNFDMVRWVEPENLHVLRDFQEEELDRSLRQLEHGK
jgi:hypothetical protein